MCCWAIAAAGNIEALWGIKYHQSVELSVQGTEGRGGTMMGGWTGGLLTHAVPFCPRTARL
jgi:hypothetical protein